MKRALRAVAAPIQPDDHARFGDADTSFDDFDAPHAGGHDILLHLHLNADDLERLDQVSRETKYTRSRWVAALVHKALSGRAQPRTADRINIAHFVRQLRKIETTMQKSTRQLAELEATARECLARCREMERFRGEVGRMAGALDEVFRGNDVYWREVVDAAEQISNPRSTDRSIR
jgi:hypothetical protein